MEENINLGVCVPPLLEISDDKDVEDILHIKKCKQWNMEYSAGVSWLCFHGINGNVVSMHAVLL